jgi:lipid-A-disaccharide synthase
MQSADILILSNGPGEVATWVRPVVQALRQQLGDDRTQIRFSLVLSPCPNASGREVTIAQTYPELDRIQSAAHFFSFLLTGKTAENWDWHDRGVVLFLGGDQFYSVVIGKRLGYRIVIYGEWDTRWHAWVDRFGVMKPALIDRAPRRYAHKFTVVGDLLAEAAAPLADCQLPLDAASERVGLLPGSKPAKLAQGMPLALSIAHHIQVTRPQTRFVIPVAPTLDLFALARFADPQHNPVVQRFPQGSATLIADADPPFLKSDSGVRVELCTEFPAYRVLSQCRLCLTTVGANTAELGSLAVPMLVLLPTYQLDAMRAWDGLPGLFANLPGAGSVLAKLINWLFLRKSRLLAWPNIWAGEAIVPELVGRLEPQQVAHLALDLLSHPQKLAHMRDRLRQVRGTPGAAQKLAQLVAEALEAEMQNQD